jgi:PAS domain S-box-containing protein
LEPAARFFFAAALVPAGRFFFAAALVPAGRFFFAAALVPAGRFFFAAALVPTARFFFAAAFFFPADDLDLVFLLPAFLAAAMLTSLVNGRRHKAPIIHGFLRIREYVPHTHLTASPKPKKRASRPPASIRASGLSEGRIHPCSHVLTCGSPAGTNMYGMVSWKGGRAMNRMKVGNREIRDADVFQILLDNFPDIIHSVDDDGNIVFTNKKAEALLGYPREELLSMNVREIYADEVVANMQTGFEQLKAEGDKQMESILKARDGTRIPVEIRSFSIYDNDGNFIRTFSILRDIRPIKELQNGLIHASRLAAIGELASGIAHDINNPLTVILLSQEMTMRSFARLTEPAAAPVERIKQLAEDVGRAARSIQKLVDHLRNFSRGVAEKYETVDIWTSINDAVFMARNKVMKSQVTVGDRTVKGRYFTVGSVNQLEQVFVNLIGNACDAMADRDKRELTISVEPRTHEGEEYWCCEVRDTGPGIPEEVRRHMFESFFTTKQKGKGTGLGLSITRAIVKDHGGRVEVESAEGEGSAFRIYLPRVAPEAQATAQP